MARTIYGNRTGKAARDEEPILAPDNKQYKSHLCPFCAKYVIPFFDKTTPHNGLCATHGTVTFASMYDYEASLFREAIKALRDKWTAEEILRREG